MDQHDIIEILDRHVFAEEKAALLQTIAKYPERYVGIFRSTTPRLKLLQNLLQSREIRFGDALEEVIAGLLPAMGFEPLIKRFQVDGTDLSCDQYFCTSDHTRYYLIEQKVRDDHDSTKKRGQIDNFRKKLEYLRTVHGSSLTGIMYFIDPALHKNEGYYRREIEVLHNKLGIPVLLFYNGALFQYLEGHTGTWDLLLTSLQNWRSTTPETVVLDYDANPEIAIEEIALVPGKEWYKLISTNALWDSGVLQALFPTGQTLGSLPN